ncbi:MAG: DUF6328 family protein [Sulfurifustaceae bacterium]
MDTDNECQREELSLSDAAEYLLQECRTVLPGIQALFGFQLVSVFNDGFSKNLTGDEQYLHLLAIAVIAVATAIIMTPAAYHRQAGARQVTERFIRVSSRLLLWSMPFLAVGVCLDFYLIARIIAGNPLATAVALALFAAFAALWFVLPRTRRLQRLLGKKT